MNQGLVKDDYFLPVIRKWTFLIVKLEALAVTMEDLYKSFLSLFLTVVQSNVQESYYLSYFQTTPNSRAAHAQDILKILKSDLCKYFASNTTSYIWMH